jgi:ATP-dependent Lhr-like helicase
MTDSPRTPAADVLDRFSPATRAWFTGAFAAPTAAQLGAWEAITAGGNALVVAPTGSGKTLAAFLAALDRLAFGLPPSEPLRRCRVLYVSPLKALAVDVERNLRSPLAGLRQAAARLGLPEPSVQIAVRSGDTPADARRRFQTKPADILITTPESLFLVLTSAAREALRGVETVIVDEVHALAGGKRGAHLALSLERLDALLEHPAQRVGLSATVRPVEEVASYLGGVRPVRVVAPPSSKTVRLDVVVPVEDMTALGDGEGEAQPADAGGARLPSVWPHVEQRIVELVESERSTIVFANSRRLAERLCGRLNEIHAERLGLDLPDADHAPAELMAQAGADRAAPPLLARAHHGSVSKEQRAEVEEALKAGVLPAVVATSSLELGIDMGAVDLVVQVESPPSVASGLQRVGRAGHQVGAVSRGVIFPKYRGDLVQAAVVAERMRDGRIEALRLPRNPLDVLAQQVVAMVAVQDWEVGPLLELVRRAAPFAGLPESAFRAVLDMLSGRYPGDEFAELRPRLVWDRHEDRLTARPGAQRLAVTSGGTIPDRGLFGVFLAGESGARGGRRVGELDEEMVYESRVGDVFTLGSTSWRIEDITHDRVLVSPAPGVPGKLPFWHGDAPGRPIELGRALGAFVRELGSLDEPAAMARLGVAGLDTWAASNLLAYLREQREATGHLPDDRTIVVERFRDELGDWRVVVHSPFGAQVHAPWALAIGARLRTRFGLDAQVMHADDGIVLRLPETQDDWYQDADSEVGGPSGLAAVPSAELAMFPSTEIEDTVTAEVGGSALFAARFRECAGRALLLPRRRPGQRTPLWQQRQRSAQLLAVASRYASFPIVLETVRECLQDVFDVPGLVELLRDVEARRVRVVEVETRSPSPFAGSLLFGYVAQFMYEGDSPLAERRAAALTLDSALLAELLGQAELRDLLDPQVIADVEAELQRLAPDRRARDVEGAADLLRLLGPLSTDAARERGVDPAWLVELEGARRVIRVRLPGVVTADGSGSAPERWAAIEDAGRLRDALGAALPVGVPEAFTEPVADPLGDLLSRYARTHGPFTAATVAAEFGLGVAVATGGLRRLVASGRLMTGEFRPGGLGVDWCDAEVLRRIRRRTLAALRREVEPVPPRALARMLPAWQGVGGTLRGVDGVLRVVEQLAGVPVPASALERLVLPSRVVGYRPGMLDELTAAGEVLWAGAGGLPGNDGWVVLTPSQLASSLLPAPVEALVPGEVQRAALAALGVDAALFFGRIAERVRAVDGLSETTDAAVLAALWDLVWAGYVTNDTFAPVRALLTGGRTRHPVRPPAPRLRYSQRGLPSTGRAAGTAGPTAVGRWSRLPDRRPEGDRARAAAVVETLLDRYGVVTRGEVAAERLPGGFAGVYPVLAAFEETGRCRRGYFVEGLGAAQFAAEGAVDRLRALHSDAERRAAGELGAPGGAAPESGALVLAATDPANAYGAALAWPARPGESAGAAKAGHKPGRKSGALVVLVDGDLVLYVERGGKSLLSWTQDESVLQPAADALALAVREGMLGKLTVARTDGAEVLGPGSDAALALALERAGFRATPQGLRLRG